MLAQAADNKFRFLDTKLALILHTCCQTLNISMAILFGTDSIRSVLDMNFGAVSLLRVI